MIGLEDRQEIFRGIEVARESGARLSQACQIVDISARTLQRWQSCDGLRSGDRRPCAQRPRPAQSLSEAEKAQILQLANEPRFADKPAARIVPALADEGVYLASESSFYRVLRDHGQSQHRGRAKAPGKSRPPSTHVATAARQLWSWDMTYLASKIHGV